MANIVRRLKRAVARHGPYATTVLALQRAFRPLLRAIRALREWWFDLRYGVDTRGLLESDERGERQDAEPYEGVSPRLFNKIIQRLQVEPGELTFVDIGCGKGKALVLAGEYGFRRVIGVEVSDKLAELARENLRARGIMGQIETAEATRMRFPDEALLVFLYNPFGEATLRAVLEELQDSLHRNPRRVIAVYVNPRQNHVFAHFSDFTEIASEGRLPDRRWWIAWEA